MLQPSKIIQLSDEFSVAPDVDVLSLSFLKAKGYRSVVNLRTDDENDRKLSSAKVKQVSHFLNMDYRHFPVFGFEVTELDKVRKFLNLIDKLPKPIVAYCRAGTRAAYLWASVHAMSGQLSLSSIEQIIVAAGFDYSAVEDELREMAYQSVGLQQFLQDSNLEINPTGLPI